MDRNSLQKEPDQLLLSCRPGAVNRLLTDRKPTCAQCENRSLDVDAFPCVNCQIRLH